MATRKRLKDIFQIALVLFGCLWLTSLDLNKVKREITHRNISSRFFREQRIRVGTRCYVRNTRIRCQAGAVMAEPAGQPTVIPVEMAEEIHITKLLERFKAADVDGDNALSPEEFRSVLECSEDFCLTEHWLPMERVNQLIRKYDKDGNGKIGINEFILVAEDHMLLQGAMADYETAFNAIDKDNDGLITKEQVSALTENLNHTMSPWDLDSAMKLYGNGRTISFTGFLGLAHQHFYEIKELLNYLEMPTGEADIFDGQLSKEEIEKIGEEWKRRRAELCSSTMRSELCEMILLSNSKAAAFKNIDNSKSLLKKKDFDDAVFGGLSVSADPVVATFRVKPFSAVSSGELKEERKDKQWKMPSLFSGSSIREFGKVQEITSEEEFDNILRESYDQTVVLEVEFTFCRACKAFAKKYSKYAALYPKVRFVKVSGNINESVKRLCKDRLGVTFSPAFFAFREGRILSTHVGTKEERFRDFLRADLLSNEIP